MFKDDEYTFKELFSFYLTKKKHFQYGEVINTSTGEMFDISEIKDVKSQYYELLKEVTNTIGNDNDRRIKWAIEHEYKENRYKELKEKFEKDITNLEEMQEYIKLKKEFDSDFLKGRCEFSISYDSFIILNINEKIPKTVKYIDKGRFLDMLHFLSYDNIMKHNPRKNGRAIKKEELMEELGFNDYSSYRKFINVLIKNNLIKEVPTNNKTKVIILNPIYVNRNIRIDYTTYLMFQSDLKKFLTKEEIKIIELMGIKDELICSYEIN